MDPKIRILKSVVERLKSFDFSSISSEIENSANSFITTVEADAKYEKLEDIETIKKTDFSSMSQDDINSILTIINE